MKANGTFEVKLNPLDFSAQGSEGRKLGRMSINKKFNGPLDASSIGEMLSVMTTVKGSAGYVAIEEVSGTLDGKKGGFVLQHFGVMNKGADQLILEVVPDSGSEELATLSGKMVIKIESGTHYYEFDYSLS
jgi:hypothetical protein